MIGLIGAARHYSPDKGANFETYAGIRIRGAMLDEARRAASAPRAATSRPFASPPVANAPNV